tara:strand:- start:278 stop:571 length:294 start_codon:yes stop_codon:yes gene_type:complete
MNKLKPINGKILLKPIEEDEQMVGNIVLPELDKQSSQIGEVVKTSQFYNFHTGEYLPSKVKPGDIVYIAPMSGVSIKVEEKEYWVIDEPSILLIVEK